MGSKKMGSKKIGTKIPFLGRNAFVLLVTFMFLCFGSVAFASVTIVNNSGLTLDEGATGTITSDLLSATTDDPLVDDATLAYTVTTVSVNGALQVSESSASSFTQADRYLRS